MKNIRFRRPHFRYKDDKFAGFSYWGPVTGGFESPMSISSCYVQDGLDQQFTGSKDIDSVDIYEGDILSIKPNSEETLVVPVEFFNGCFCYKHKGTYFPFYSPSPGFGFTKFRKVVGHIYKNDIKNL